MEQDNGFIGDIKYSVLEPGIFTERHPGWVLLKGQNPNKVNPDDDDIKFKDSQLANLGFTELPDARGMFLRGINMSRTDEFADADGDNRNILTPQKNSIRAHSHSIQDVFSISLAGVPWGPGPDNHVRSHYGQSITTGETGDTETRPNNIALYIYIKID